MAFLEKYLEVKASNLPGAGSGLFSKIAIAAGERIIEYTGRIRTWKEVKNEDDNMYILFVTNKHIIDAKKRKNSLGRYINDANGLIKIKGFTNNTQFVREGNRIFVEAIKNIPEGSELFVGYGKDYWDVIRENQKIDAMKNE